MKRCANRTAVTTSRTDIGWMTSAGVAATMPFQIRTAASQPSSPGRSKRAFDPRVELVELLRRQGDLSALESGKVDGGCRSHGSHCLSLEAASGVRTTHAMIRVEDGRAGRAPHIGGNPYFASDFSGACRRTHATDFSSIAQSQLGQDAADMVLDGLRADESVR